MSCSTTFERKFIKSFQFGLTLYDQTGFFFVYMVLLESCLTCWKSLYNSREQNLHIQLEKNRVIVRAVLYLTKPSSIIINKLYKMSVQNTAEESCHSFITIYILVLDVLSFYFFNFRSH